MSAAIGPGNIVQAVRSNLDRWAGAVDAGAIYRIGAIIPSYGACHYCGSTEPTGLTIEGQPLVPHGGGFFWSWCPCFFRPYPPPADEALLSEQSPTNEKVEA